MLEVNMLEIIAACIALVIAAGSFRKARSESRFLLPMVIGAVIMMLGRMIGPHGSVVRDAMGMLGALIMIVSLIVEAF